MKKRVVIHIGEYWASRDPAIISTVLGSCVAVCLFEPALRMGGMNHILLPGKADTRAYDDVARYGVNAMELLINRIMNLGGRKSKLVAKVFGGANVLPSLSGKMAGMGDANVDFALGFLEKENIPVINSDVGGKDSRRIYFHTDTSEVLLRRTPSRGCRMEGARGLTKVERELRKKGEVVLFDQQLPLSGALKKEGRKKQ